MTASQIIEFLLLLLIAASVIALAAHRLRVPYTVALVLGGFGIDFFHVPIQHMMGSGSGARAHLLTPDVVFILFLPALLFEAGININFRSLRSTLAPIVLLATAGVMVALAVTGFAVHWFIGIPLLPAIIFGALISATDPVAVLALFRSLGIEKRLAVLIEGESLLNDGTAIVLFQIMIAVATGAGSPGVADGVRQFAIVAIGGAALGLAFGYAASRITSHIDDARIEITLSMIIAYGTYLVAEHLHVSGVLATVMAGLMIGSYGARVGMSPRTRVALWAYWEYVSFAINSLLFLLIGIEVHFSELLAAWSAILLATLFVVVGRAAAVYSLVPLSNLFTTKIPVAWRHVTVWGGLHGAVSLALALSLPADLPGRGTILTITFGVVAFSIVVQGLTMKPLLRFLRIAMGEVHEHDILRIHAIAAKAAQRELEHLASESLISPGAQKRLRTELEDRLAGLREQIAQIEERHPESLEKDLRLARARMAAAEKSAIRAAAADGLVSPETEDDLIREADRHLDTLEP
ncbi:MAG: Na+/H+ antiporter [Terriglobia bacterium]